MIKKEREFVQVAVRIKPLESHSGKTFIRSCSENSVLLVSDNNSAEFLVDRVFGESCTNAEIHQSFVSEVVTKVALEGGNGTIFAYGQTASGKTHTMMGTVDDPGIIILALNQIFDIIKKTDSHEFLLRISYLEIYNEGLRDLLATDSDDKKDASLVIRKDPSTGTVYVTNLKEEIVTSVKSVLKFLKAGQAKRATSVTDFNLHSSRSHTLLQMVIESRLKGPRSNVVVSQLNLIDLAGSEKATNNSERRIEGSYINRSLLALGTVINKLTSATAQKSSSNEPAHIPYRDSKLTRLLQPALEGNGRVLVMVTIQQEESNREESVNSLKFATRIKTIQPKPSEKQYSEKKSSETLIDIYREEIRDLREQLAKAAITENGLSQSNSNISLSNLSDKAEIDKIVSDNERLSKEVREQELARNVLKEKIEHLTKLILTSNSKTLNNEEYLITENTAEKRLKRSDVVNSIFCPQNSLIDLKHEDSIFQVVNAHKVNSDSKIKNLVTENEELKKELAHIKNKLFKMEKTEFDLRLKEPNEESKLLFRRNTFPGPSSQSQKCGCYAEISHLKWEVGKQNRLRLQVEKIFGEKLNALQSLLRKKTRK